MTAERHRTPRYLAYCHAHGEADPDAMLARDRATYPGGKMTGFQIWTICQWHEWAEATGLRGKPHPVTDEHNAAFDAWLVSTYPPPAAPQKPVERPVPVAAPAPAPEPVEALEAQEIAPMAVVAAAPLARPAAPYTPDLFG